MKFKNKMSLLFLLTIFLNVGFSSCTVDEPVIITPKTVDQYIAQFSQYVASERANLDSCKVGYNKGNFAQVSATSFNTYTNNYRVVLQADSAVIVKPGVTIAELVNANTSLAVPGKAFWGKINISDRRPLNDAIVDATNLNNSTLVGTATGQVLQNAKSAFGTAIATAITTRDALTTIDRQVTDGVTLLTAAEQTFHDAIVK